MFFSLIFALIIGTLIFSVSVYSLGWCFIKAFSDDDYIPPCSRSDKYNGLANYSEEPFYIVNTQGCGYKIVDKLTGQTIAEMLPNGKWINYYLGETEPR